MAEAKPKTDPVKKSKNLLNSVMNEQQHKAKYEDPVNS